MDGFDLTGVRSVTLVCGWQTPPKGSLNFEATPRCARWRLLGKGSIPPVTRKGSEQSEMATIPVVAVNDGSEHAIYILIREVGHLGRR